MRPIILLLPQDEHAHTLSIDSRHHHPPLPSPTGVVTARNAQCVCDLIRLGPRHVTLPQRLVTWLLRERLMSGMGVVLVCLCVCPLIKEMKNYSSEIYVTNWCEYVIIIWSPVLEVIRFLVHLTRELFFLSLIHI